MWVPAFEIRQPHGVGPAGEDARKVTDRTVPVGMQDDAALLDPVDRAGLVEPLGGERHDRLVPLGIREVGELAREPGREDALGNETKKASSTLPSEIEGEAFEVVSNILGPHPQLVGRGNLGGEAGDDLVLLSKRQAIMERRPPSLGQHPPKEVFERRLPLASNRGLQDRA